MKRTSVSVSLAIITALLLTQLSALHAADKDNTVPPAQNDLSSKLRVPDGFVVEKVVGPPDLIYPMFAAFDDRGRLFVAESSGGDLWADCNNLVRSSRIRLLEDLDGDGRFETSKIFADGLVPVMGLAWRNGRLFAADPPNIITIEDTTGNGHGDRRTFIAGDFGHQINSGLHGLVFGPDGMLYSGTGGSNSYRVQKSDGTIAKGESGALFRCRPDGSKIEVLARGFGNLVEIVFLPSGEMIGTDTWFIQPPNALRDALVHVVEGGHYPCYGDSGVPSFSSGALLPAISLYPAVAPSGLTLYRSQSYPTAFSGNLFSAQFGSRKVLRHVLTRAGSTFTSKEEDFVSSDSPDFHPTDVVEAPDGSLLIVDTGSWYVHHCPGGQINPSSSKGGIYRVRYAKTKTAEDPCGKLINWAKVGAEQAVGFLGDSRPIVQDRAQEKLVAGGELAAPFIAAHLAHSADTASKQRAIWTLARMSGDASLELLRKTLRDSTADVAATAARALAVRHDSRAAGELCRLLGPELPLHLRMAAAEALAHCGGSDSLPALWQALASQPDQFLEHALIYAAHRLCDDHALQEALQNPHPRVQKAALMLLDQPSRKGLSPEAVIQRVTATDADLRQMALQVLKKHRDWAKQAVPILLSWLEKPSLTEEDYVGLRSLILAFQNDASVQSCLANALDPAYKNTSTPRRVFLLGTMAASSLSKLPTPWREGLAQALQDSDILVRRQAVETIAVLQPEAFETELTKLAENLQEPADFRLATLRAVVLRRPTQSAATMDFLIGKLHGQEDPLSRIAAADVLQKSKLTDAQLLRAFQAIAGDALISPDSLLPAFHEMTGVDATTALLDDLAGKIRKGWRPREPDLQKVLDRLPVELQKAGEAIRSLALQGAERGSARLVALEPLLTGGNPKLGRDIFFGSKVACYMCHRIGSEGGLVGPDLSRIGAFRSGPSLLESIVFPSASFAQGYEPYVVATKDGSALYGIIGRQSGDSVFLRDLTGGEAQIKKSQIKKMKRAEISSMPQGLDLGLTAEEFRNLLGFLQSLK